MKEKNKISLIIPAYNEEKAIVPVVEEALPFVDEIIIVDDGSKDNTLAVSEKYIREYSEKHPDGNKKIKIIRHAVNSGKVKALCSGVEASSGEIIIFTDGDFTYPASSIPKMLEEIQKGADLVLGSRLKDKQINGNMRLHNRIGNNIFSFITSYISGVSIADPTTGLRVFKKSSFEKLNVCAKSLEYEIKMTVRAAKLGYKIVEIPISLRNRIGKSKLSPIIDGLKMIWALAQICYSETSILSRTIMLPSIIFLLLGLFFGVQCIIDYATVGAPVHPYYPLLTVFSSILGIQLFSLGLIIDNLTKKLTRIEEGINPNHNEK
jgi:dolichol-phosphate mannosyltransferase